MLRETTDSAEKPCSHKEKINMKTKGFFRLKWGLSLPLLAQFEEPQKDVAFAFASDGNKAKRDSQN